MRDEIFQRLGRTLKAARLRRGLTQPELASRLGRTTSRISELETDLARGRLGKDRLTLLAEICDALDLVPVLIPRDQVSTIEQQIGRTDRKPGASVQGSVFDDVFVDLFDADDEEPSV